MKKNYHKIMVEELDQLEGRPRLLLHSCCAPCSTYVLEYLSDHFDLEVFFYNPNIYPEEEYGKRLEEQVRFIEERGWDYRVLGPAYDSREFFQAVQGYEHLGERSERCLKCIGQRLERTAAYGEREGFDYFTSTLTISPMKDAQAINALGMELEKAYDIRFLRSDFKKNEGFKRSLELSRDHGLYRQNYCGCVFSKREYEERREEASKNE